MTVYPGYFLPDLYFSALPRTLNHRGVPVHGAGAGASTGLLRNYG